MSKFVFKKISKENLTDVVNIAPASDTKDIDNHINSIFEKSDIMTTTIDIKINTCIDAKQLILLNPIYCGRYIDCLNKKYTTLLKTSCKQSIKQQSDTSTNTSSLNNTSFTDTPTHKYLSNKLPDFMHTNSTQIINMKYNNCIRGIPKTYSGMKNTAIVRIIHNGIPATINVAGNNFHICGSKSEMHAKTMVKHFTNLIEKNTDLLLNLRFPFSKITPEIRYKEVVKILYEWRYAWYLWLKNSLEPLLTQKAKNIDTQSAEYKNENIVNTNILFKEILLDEKEYISLTETSPDATICDFLLSFLPEFDYQDVDKYINYIKTMIFFNGKQKSFTFTYDNEFIINIVNLLSLIFETNIFTKDLSKKDLQTYIQQSIDETDNNIAHNLLTSIFKLKDTNKLTINKYRSTLYRFKYDIGFMIDKFKLYKIIDEKETDFRVLNFQDNQQSKITIYLPITDYKYDFMDICDCIGNCKCYKEKDVNVYDNGCDKNLQDGYVKEQKSQDLSDTICDNNKSMYIDDTYETTSNSSESSSTSIDDTVNYLLKKKPKKRNVRRHAFEISHEGIVNQSSPSKELAEIACKRMLKLLNRYYDDVKL